MYADLGLLQDRLGREDLARESYETAFALGDLCSQPRINLGSMLLEDGEYAEAALHYQKAVTIKPSAKAYSGLGFSLDQLGRLDEASTAHRKAVQLDPKSGEAHANLALNHARKKELVEAVAAYRRAVALDPRVSTYYSLAGVLRALGRDQEAEVEYENARRLSAAQPAPPRRQES